MKFKLSLCTAKEPVQKTLSLDEETQKLVKHPPPYFPNEFKVTEKEVDFRGLASLLKNAKPNQFLIHGVPPEGAVRVVTKDKKDQVYKDKPKVVSRTPTYFKYPVGSPGLFMIDVDIEGYDLDDILQTLAEVFAPFAQAGYACMQSSSSNMYHHKTQLSSQKWHIYFVAEEGQDIERFGRALFERAVLMGHGHIFLSIDGKQHVRTLFDLAVIAPYRIDFIAPPNIVKPVTQHDLPPESSRGKFLPTHQLKDLNRRERGAFNKIVKQMKEETIDEAMAKRERHIESRIHEHITKTGHSYETAKEVVHARYVDADEVRLHFDDLLTFEDGDKESVFVKDIIMDVDEYVGRSVRDPLEPEYGEGKAKIYLSSGRLLINSFVHGGRKFILSGNTIEDYDTDNNAKILGFRLDTNAVNGSWSDLMLKNWVKVNDGGKIKYARLMPENNRFIPVPERGEQYSGLFELEPMMLFDEKNFLCAIPSVKVVTGWDVKESQPKEEDLGYAFLKLPNIEFKDGGITMMEPTPEVESHFLNKWFGFPVTPRRDKVHKVIDQYFDQFIEFESEEGYEYFWSYIYHMFQHPFEKPGSAILFQSGQGTGKGTFIQLLASLIGPIHSGFIDKMESLTGRFNDVIAGKLLIYADEIMFGGYHQANNVLKKIITDEYLSVEPKFQSVQRIYNVSRLFFSTNEQWALNIERGDRRFFVPTVSNTFAKDVEFFTELRYQWNRCYDAVMNRFMVMPITADLSNPPMTRGKNELIKVSLHPAQDFMFETLQAGYVENHTIDFAEDKIEFHKYKSTEISKDLFYKLYLAHHKANYGSREVTNKNVFWREVYGCFGNKDNSGIKEQGRIGTSKQRIVFPPLDRMRLLWDESHGSDDFEDDSPHLSIVKGD